MKHDIMLEEIHWVAVQVGRQGNYSVWSITVRHWTRSLLSMFDFDC